MAKVWLNTSLTFVVDEPFHVLRCLATCSLDPTVAKVRLHSRKSATPNSLSDERTFGSDEVQVKNSVGKETGLHLKFRQRGAKA